MELNKIKQDTDSVAQKDERYAKLKQSYSDVFDFDEENGVLRVLDGVRSIGKAQVRYLHASNIKHIILSNSLEEINYRCFANLANLQTVTFANPKKSKNLKKIGNLAFFNCSNLIDFEYSDSLVFIGNGAFENCSKLQCFSLAKDVTKKEIKSKAFGDCESLQEINNLEGLEVLGKSAFVGCVSLAQFDIPEGCKSVLEYAFYDCTNLKKVTLPSTLKQIGSEVFADCCNLESVQINNNAQFKVENNILLMLDDDVNAVRALKGASCLPESVTQVLKGCFSKAVLDKVVLNKAIKNIQARAFFEAKVKELVLPEGDGYISPGAFVRASIGAIYMPKGNLDIAPDAFKSCSIDKVYVDADNLNYKGDENGNLLLRAKDSKNIYFCKDEKYVKDGKRIENVCAFIPLDCEEYVLPENIEFVGSCAFVGGDKLKKFVINSKVDNLVSGCVKGAPNLEYFDVSNENKHLFKENNGIYRVRNNGDKVLYCATKNTVVSDDVTELGLMCFTYRTNIERIVPVGYDKEVQPNTIYLPNTVKKVGVEAFGAMPDLEELVLPDSVEEVGEYFVWDCPKLAKVVLPLNLKTNFADAFLYSVNGLKLPKLSHLEIPYNDNLLDGKNANSLCAFSNSEQNIKMYIRYMQNGEEQKLLLPEHMVEAILSNVVCLDESGDFSLYYINPNQEQVVKRYNFDDLLYNATQKNHYNWLPFFEVRKLEKYNKLKEQNKKAFLPDYVVTMCLPKEQIQSYYELAPSKGKNSAGEFSCWQDLLKNGYIKGESEPLCQNNGQIRLAIFKLAVSLGLFVRDKDRYLSLGEVCDFINNEVLKKHDSQTIIRLFDNLDSYNVGYNKDYAMLFMHCFAKCNQEGKIFLDFVNAENTGKQLNGIEKFYSNFNALIKYAQEHHKEISPEFKRKHNANLIQLDDIEACYTNQISYNLDKYLSLTDEQKDVLVRDFAKYLSTNARYDEKQFKILLKWYLQGVKNYANALNKEQAQGRRDLALKIVDMQNLMTKEEYENSEFKWSLLSKTNPEQAVLGDLSNCCQTVSETGASCVKYGMVKPNSGFMEFRNKNGLFVGQGWVWYNKDTKNITIDNIEIPQKALRGIPYLENAFKKMLNEVVQGFVQAMGQENINMITMGMGRNDISNLLKTKAYKLANVKVDINSIYLIIDKILNMSVKEVEALTEEDVRKMVDEYIATLSESDIELLKAGCPKDFTTSEMRKDGDDFIKKAYSDATLDVGQVLLWQNPLIQVKSEEKTIERN